MVEATFEIALSAPLIVQSASDSVQALPGYAAQDFLSSEISLANLVHPEDRVMMAAYFEEEVVGRRQPFNKEYRIVRRSDGAERWVSGLGKLEFNAEGVETVEHGLMLLRLGCQAAQGYGIAKPMPAHDFPAWVSSWAPDHRWKNVLPFDPSNRPVLYASVEHHVWVVAIEDFLNGKRDKALVLDFDQCRFGIWLRSEALVQGVVLPRRGGLLGFRTIDEIHQKFHASANEILSLHGDGRQAEAMGRIAELQALRDELFEKLNNLLQP